MAEKLTDLGKYTLTLSTVIHESNATTFGGRELPSYKLKFTISGKENHKTSNVIFVMLSACPNHTLPLFLSFSEGSAESFVIGEVSTTLRIGVPFDIPLLIKDGYDHSVMSPPDLKPELKCRLVAPLYLKRCNLSFVVFSVDRLLRRPSILIA